MGIEEILLGDMSTKTSHGLNQPVYSEVIPWLQNNFHNKYTWELVDEKVVGDRLFTTVNVIIPGQKLTGRSVIGLKDCADNHLRAIFNAVLPICTPNTVVKNGDGKPINNTTELYNAQNKDGSAATSVEFDKLTDNAINELNKENGFVPSDPLENTQTQQPQPQQTNTSAPQQPAQQPKKNGGYTNEQIAGVRKFMQEYEIQNDEQFGNYVHSWSNGKLKHKKDITPDNVDSFLEWIRNLNSGE